jgi:TRAP-type C4-dicarboxylate transport system permease large subunit
MKNIISIFLFFLVLLLSSCQAIGDIFKAGVWVGVLMVVGFIALVIYLITRGSNKN